MTAERIIKQLRQANIDITKCGNNLKWRAPSGGLNSEIQKLLRDHKNEILEFLSPPEPLPSHASIELQNCDCLTAMKGMADNSVDCIVTDPPYGLKFMSKDWDSQVPGVAIWKECLRVLKPGAFAFVMASPRQDILCQMIKNLADAGFYTGFTSLYWTYASGFPKASNINAAINRRTVANHKVGEQVKVFNGAYAGFQPKPAVEVILVAMKPLDKKSYTDQAVSNGKGITWLDDCKIPVIDPDGNADQGRFPANLLISDNILDCGKISKGGIFPAQRGKTEYFGLNQKRSDRVGQIHDQGGYSRYFSLDEWAQKNLPFLNVPKATTKEKEQGLEAFEKKQIKGRDFGQDIRNNPYKLRPVERGNNHPTVKPIKLMAYLVTMGSRDGDTILDPFCGTGTTCIASFLLKRKSIGIEVDDYYFKLANARAQHWFKQGFFLN